MEEDNNFNISPYSNENLSEKQQSSTDDENKKTSKKSNNKKENLCYHVNFFIQYNHSPGIMSQFLNELMLYDKLGALREISLTHSIDTLDTQVNL